MAELWAALAGMFGAMAAYEVAVTHNTDEAYKLARKAAAYGAAALDVGYELKGAKP